MKKNLKLYKLPKKIDFRLLFSRKVRYYGYPKSATLRGALRRCRECLYMNKVVILNI